MRDRLLKSYENTYKKFNQYFGILLGFSLLFLFIILFPYITVIENPNSIEKKLDSITYNISKVTNSSNFLKESESGIKII